MRCFRFCTEKHISGKTDEKLAAAKKQGFLDRILAQAALTERLRQQADGGFQRVKDGEPTPLPDPGEVLPRVVEVEEERAPRKQAAPRRPVEVEEDVADDGGAPLEVPEAVVIEEGPNAAERLKESELMRSARHLKQTAGRKPEHKRRRKSRHTPDVSEEDEEEVPLRRRRLLKGKGHEGSSGNAGDAEIDADAQEANANAEGFWQSPSAEFVRFVEMALNPSVVECQLKRADEVDPEVNRRRIATDLIRSLHEMVVAGDRYSGIPRAELVAEQKRAAELERQLKSNDDAFIQMRQKLKKYEALEKELREELKVMRMACADAEAEKLALKEKLEVIAAEKEGLMGDITEAKKQVERDQLEVETLIAQVESLTAEVPRMQEKAVEDFQASERFEQLKLQHIDEGAAALMEALKESEYFDWKKYKLDKGL